MRSDSVLWPAVPGHANDGEARLLAHASSDRRIASEAAEDAEQLVRVAADPEQAHAREAISDTMLTTRDRVFSRTLTALAQDRPENLVYVLGFPEDHVAAERLFGRSLTPADLSPAAVRYPTGETREARGGLPSAPDLAPPAPQESGPQARYAAGRDSAAQQGMLQPDAGRDSAQASTRELAQEADATLNELEQLVWTNDAAIADFYRRRSAIIRRALGLPETGGPANKTELVLQFRYLRRVDEALAARRERNEKILSRYHESQLDNSQAAALIEDLGTVNWQNGIELAALLQRHEATLEKLIAPRTFAECPASVPYQRLDWVLSQYPELKARMNRARAEEQKKLFARIAAQVTDVEALTDALARTDIDDDEAMQRVYLEYKDTVEQIFAHNQTVIPAAYSGRDALVWSMTAMPAMGDAVNAKRLQLRETRVYEEPGYQYLNQADFLERYRESLSQDASRPDDQQETMVENAPSAFQFRNVIYFNIDHPDSRDAIKGGRSVAHEITHVATRNERRANARFFEEMQAGLEQAGLWQELSGLVCDAFGERGASMPDDEILDEALAIYLGGERHPYSRESDAGAWRIDQILAGVRSSGEPAGLAAKLNAIGARVNAQYETVAGRLAEAAKQSEHADKIMAEYTDEKLRTNVQTRDEVNAGINEQIEEEKSKLTDPTDIADAIADARETIDSFRKNVDDIRAAGRRAGTAQAAEDEKSIALIEAYIREYDSDLTTADGHAKALKRWKLPEKAGGLKQSEKDSLMKEWNFGPDEATNLAAMTAGLSEFVAGLTTPIGAIKKFITQERPEAPLQQEKGVWGTIRDYVFSNGKHAEWVSWSDLVKIVGVFKEAIQARWAEGKDRKAYRIADNLARGNWLASPIEHTLKKQSRAANEKQTSEFLDYLKTAGLNYDQLIAQPGGLYWRLNNVNEKKAVLEFCAGKAWLFDLDKLDGHNVYGMDYAAQFGPEQFEDLVQSYEGGKAKMEKEGVEKIDKDADVTRMMDVLTHELRHKNIFVVQGIMKRLQDKAKYSHSNTWMLTTLLMLIRDESGKDPELKKCLDKGMIDNISNHTIQQCSWSITWLKMRRHEIDAWKQGKDDFGNNIVTKTMEQLEKRLEEAGAEFPDTPEGRLAKYEAIGMALSGKTLYKGNSEFVTRVLSRYGKNWKPDAHISIFEESFRKYRDDYNKETTQAGCAPSKTDADYFNSELGGSDITMLHVLQIKKILYRDSVGQFQNSTQAAGFIAQVCNRHAELGRVDRSAQYLFEQEMRAKLSLWWNDMDDARWNAFHSNKDQEGRPMWEQLLKCNLLNRQARATLYKSSLEKRIGNWPADSKHKEKERIDDIMAKAQKLADARNGGD